MYRLVVLAYRTFCRAAPTSGRHDAATAPIGPGPARVTLAPMSDYLTEMFSLSGRIALVTGGSSGIGLGMAEALARAGARVILVARDPERLREALAALEATGGQAAPVSADLSDRTVLGKAADAAGALYGEPDILVNCARIQ